MDAVPALVGALVEVALVVEVGPEPLDGARVARLGGAHEVGVGDAEHVPRLAEGGLHRVAPGLRRHAVLGGHVGHLLAVLVHAGDEGHLAPVHALVARHGVGGDGGVGRPQVRRGVDVVDRRGERVGSLRHGATPLPGADGQ